ncbi:MAG TPA: hypothetical protein VKC60_18165 [Opitutaceae bacterium]|nr:hypothetical protein [Opitutaceae bacterium]
MNFFDQTVNEVKGLRRRTIAVLLTVAMLWMVVLAASPAAHEALHPNAGDFDHECAVTLFAQGFTSPFTAFVAVLFGLRLLNRVWSVPRSPLAIPSAYRLPPLCGPPLI